MRSSAMTPGWARSPSPARFGERTDRLLGLASELADDVRDLERDAILDVPVVYASAKAGRASLDQPLDGQLPSNEDLEPLFTTILEKIPAPTYDEGAPLTAHVTNLDASLLYPSPRPRD